MGTSVVYMKDKEPIGCTTYRTVDGDYLSLAEYVGGEGKEIGVGRDKVEKRAIDLSVNHLLSKETTYSHNN
ncbi:hypothetical protein [Bacillus testis]|uniref:hypothetical protein n=1 Tax=Bacillus testis TaxID=1622072 RepID=UPI00067EE96A|nr:hypothetical protein [Bacillus testis]